MRWKNILSSLILATLLTGCRTPGHVVEGEPAKISPGMTKEEVIKKIGQPETSATEGDTQVLTYTLERPWWQTAQFKVKIVNGTVQSSEIVGR